MHGLVNTWPGRWSASSLETEPTSRKDTYRLRPEYRTSFLLVRGILHAGVIGSFAGYLLQQQFR
jgi:hypothetical protein